MVLLYIGRVLPYFSIVNMVTTLVWTECLQQKLVHKQVKLFMYFSTPFSLNSFAVHKILTEQINRKKKTKTKTQKLSQ